MIYKPDYFSLDELVCPEIYKHFGDVAWQFFDSRLLITIDTLRQKLGRRITVNDWQVHGQFTQRGFRCLQCQLVKDAIKTNQLYVSPHMTGQAIDFDVEGMVAEEVRQYIIKNQSLWPYPIRLEADVNWIHMDTRDADNGKVFLFKN
jgi:hypothetical protein